MSKIPSSPLPRRNRNPEEQSSLPVTSSGSASLLGPNTLDQKQRGVGQYEQPLQPVLMAKKKKKGQSVGYDREPEMSAGGKLCDDNQSHSGGSGVDVRPGSQQSQARARSTTVLSSS